MPALPSVVSADLFGEVVREEEVDWGTVMMD